MESSKFVYLQMQDAAKSLITHSYNCKNFNVEYPCKQWVPNTRRNVYAEKKKEKNVRTISRDGAKDGSTEL